MRQKLLSLVLAFLAGVGSARADEPAQPQVDFESHLHGAWKGGACGGILVISDDGRFERRHFSPGSNELRGTWKVRRDTLPPVLILTCQSSNAPERFPVDRTWELKLVHLDAEGLSYESDETRVNYRRMPHREEAADRLRDVVVQAKMTQVIGRFSSHGGPNIGDSFELNLGDLPRDKLQLTRPGGKGEVSYIPLSAPLGIERLNQGRPRDGQERAAIDLTTTDPSRKLRIRIVADGLKSGSKVRITFFQAEDFLGSMAEAEGVLK